jgi:hypothetical protein
MDNRISNGTIGNAINELISIVGIKENVPITELVALLNKGNIKECIKNIALHLGLTLNIELSYVSKDYQPDNTNKFNSRHLVKTDWRGRGIGSITAQVSVPENLPLYGTSALTNYPISVRVSEDSKEQPETFIAVLAHELSHVLLRSLRHSQWDNEIYTDLTPIILGFSNIIGSGRKVTEENTSGIFVEKTTTTTTTYGYLNDSQFHFACDMTRDILNKRRQNKDNVLAQTEKARKLSLKIEKNLLRFKKYLMYLDEHHNRTIKRQDSFKVVQFHSPDYTYQHEMTITNSEKTVMEIRGVCRRLIHYTESVLEELQDYDRRIRLLVLNLGPLSCSLDEDIKVLSRNVSFICLLRTALMVRLHFKFI